jgi:hypothetical protein
VRIPVWFFFVDGRGIQSPFMAASHGEVLSAVKPTRLFFYDEKLTQLSLLLSNIPSGGQRLDVKRLELDIYGA